MMDNPPLRRRRSSSPAASSPATSRLIPSLPDDLAILCIARVPRWHHPFLAAVSRAWRAVLRSPRLFSVRLEVGDSQPLLFIDFHSCGQSRWYLLDRCLRGNHSSSLIPLPVPPLPSIIGCTPVSLGHSLFLLGGSLDGRPSSVVQIYDARFNSWHLGAHMSASRQFAGAGVISGRIYVIGGCLNDSEYWAEEFDPEKDRWKRISSWSQFQEKRIIENAVIGGKLLLVEARGCVIFDPSVAAVEAQVTQDKAWSMVPMSLYLKWRGRSRSAAVGEVLYSFCYNKGKIRAYDFAKEELKAVEGVDKELPNFLPVVKLANFGEGLCLAWVRKMRDKEMEVICAGVRVTKTDTGGLRGWVEWSEMFVLAFPEGTFIAHFISLEF